MKVASLNEIKKELQYLEPEALQAMALRLVKYKKENKELLTYLLFEANNEHAYIENVKTEMEELFNELPSTSSYLIKKSLRKILRVLNRQVRYSGIKETELELRIFFCVKVRKARIPFQNNTVLFNMYQQQLKKIKAILAGLPEDLQADYEREVGSIS